MMSEGGTAIIINTLHKYPCSVANRNLPGFAVEIMHDPAENPGLPQFTISFLYKHGPLWRLH